MEKPRFGSVIRYHRGYAGSKISGMQGPGLKELDPSEVRAFIEAREAKSRCMDTDGNERTSPMPATEVDLVTGTVVEVDLRDSTATQPTDMERSELVTTGIGQVSLD